MPKETYNFNLEVLTPVHVGMGKEKDYLPGLDYGLYGGYFEIYNQSKLLNSLSTPQLNAVAAHLVNGDMNTFSKYLNNNNLITNEVIDYTWPSQFMPGNNESIKRCYQNGLGKWIIPGSSIKGVLRSAIATALFKKNGSQVLLNEKELLGNIESDLLKFLQVSDCTIEGKPGIFPVKIFSGDKNIDRKYGAWKNNRIGGHNTEFNKQDFVTYYEMLPDAKSSDDNKTTFGQFRINWGANIKIENFLSTNNRNFHVVFNNESIQWLIEVLKSHTNSFIDKEIAFFQKYSNDRLNNIFFQELEEIKSANQNSKDTFVMRIGANVGWHSITGDWKWNDYSKAIELNRQNRVQFKTRKILFDKYDDKSPIRFTLPGFVKITLQT